MKNNILITGASGFIGSWVCRLISDKNVVATVSPYSNYGRIKDLEHKIKIVKLDLSDSEEVDKIFKKYKPKAVIHLATHGVYQYQQDDVKRIVIDNYMMTANLLAAASKYNVSKFINTGSVFEYGSQNKKVRESDVSLGDILNKYSAIKMATTALVNSYAKILSVITLRPFTTYGPHEDETRFIAASIKRALNGEEFRIVKGVVRDFVYVEDVARAFAKCLNTDYKSGEIINIGSGKKQTLDGAVKVIKKITKSKSKIIHDEKYIRQKESSCWANISRAYKVLNWQPMYDFEQGITKSVDFFKK